MEKFNCFFWKILLGTASRYVMFLGALNRLEGRNYLKLLRNMTRKEIEFHGDVFKREIKETKLFLISLIKRSERLFPCNMTICLKNVF